MFIVYKIFLSGFFKYNNNNNNNKNNNNNNHKNIIRKLFECSYFTGNLLQLRCTSRRLKNRCFVGFVGVLVR